MPLITFTSWRVKDCTAGYVRRRGNGHNLYNSESKGPRLTRQQAHRLLADWLDCGYDGHVVRFTVTRFVRI